MHWQAGAKVIKVEAVVGQGEEGRKECRCGGFPAKLGGLGLEQRMLCDAKTRDWQREGQKCMTCEKIAAEKLAGGEKRCKQAHEIWCPRNAVHLGGYKETHGAVHRAVAEREVARVNREAARVNGGIAGTGNSTEVATSPLEGCTCGGYPAKNGGPELWQRVGCIARTRDWQRAGQTCMKCERDHCKKAHEIWCAKNSIHRGGYKETHGAVHKAVAERDAVRETVQCARPSLHC